MTHNFVIIDDEGELSRNRPIVILVKGRQVGKTTMLAAMGHYFKQLPKKETPKVTAYDLQTGGGLPKLKKKLLEQMKEHERKPSRSPYQPRRIPRRAYL